MRRGPQPPLRSNPPVKRGEVQPKPGRVDVREKVAGPRRSAAAIGRVAVPSATGLTAIGRAPIRRAPARLTREP